MITVIALSGGVDSSVAALRLREKGHDLIGVTMRTWPENSQTGTMDKTCRNRESIESARNMAEYLEIPYYIIDLSKEFEKYITGYFIDEYKKGRTPNPCVYCNSLIKFGYLYEKAFEMGAGKIASGHYARIVEINGAFYLAEPEDFFYDQTYFLAHIPKKMLSSIEFPLGDLTRKKVRDIAREHNCPSAWKKSSQDVCFVSGGESYREYLAKKGVNVFIPGDIIDTGGKVVGTHQGIASYTIGQRKGLGVAGPEPFYVIKLDPANNTVTIGSRSEAMGKKIRVTGINWLGRSLLERGEIRTRIRYNGEKAVSSVRLTQENEAIVTFDEEQFAPTPGQAAVFYSASIVAGGGWIEEVMI
jgi:tRNA-specific 2-thiouridylase